jgi:hypothetical protein
MASQAGLDVPTPTATMMWAYAVAAVTFQAGITMSVRSVTSRGRIEGTRSFTTKCCLSQLLKMETRNVAGKWYLEVEVEVDRTSKMGCFCLVSRIAADNVQCHSCIAYM